MKVGNIVNCNEEIDERYFNCLSIEEIMSESFYNNGYSKLPTLIVGWENVKNNFGDVSILSKIITPKTEDGYGGIYWTFSKSEKRGIYEENLKEFKESCYIDLIEGIKTYNIDPIIYKIDNDKQFFEKINNLRGGIGYLFQERIVYIYKDFKIFMVDLELMDFIGFNRDLIIKNFKENLTIFSDNLEEKFTEELKHLDIKYLPYLEFKDAV